MAVYLVTEYGYFLKSRDRVNGLLHIKNASRKYEVGDSIEVKVSSINVDRERVEFTEA